jgi:fructose-1,6-bisphosphatase/inositol monophosphatase family enzyme
LSVADIIRDVGRRELLSRFRNLQAHQIREKEGPDDLVTDADIAAEQALATALGELLPDAAFVGEETCHRDLSALGRLAEHEYAWAVDPLDGTAYFARGLEPFGIIVALIRRGIAEAGWIHLPVSGETAHAWRSAGAFLNGARVAPRPVPPLEELRGALFTGHLEPSVRAHVEARRPLVRAEETHTCAARRYLDLLAGREHFSLYGRTLPWDHAAGVLMLQEIGSVARRFDGAPYDVSDSASGLLIAPDARTWTRLRQLLLPPDPGQVAR